MRLTTILTTLALSTAVFARFPLRRFTPAYEVDRTVMLQKMRDAVRKITIDDLKAAELAKMTVRERKVLEMALEEMLVGEDMEEDIEEHAVEYADEDAEAEKEQL